MTPAAARRPSNLHEQASPGGSASPPRLAIIAAIAANGVIGAHNRLPWRLPADLRRFRALTTGHAVIMGRRTWQSIGGPLPGRQNIVVTRDASFVAPGAQTARSLDDAIALVDMPQPAFVIGGGELYREALPRAQTLHLTEIARDFDGDARFPAFARDAWRETSREPMRASPPDDFQYAFVTYERKK
jgi:dihydrofolate reductase